MNKIATKETLGGFLIIVIAFYCGRYSAPEKIKTEIKTVEVEKIVTKVEHKTIRIKENKDGSKETVIISDSKTQDEQKSKSKTELEEITRKHSVTNVSVMAGVTHPVSGIDYGISVQRNILGPFTLGAWGMTNISAGLSIGFNF